MILAILPTPATRRILWYHWLSKRKRNETSPSRCTKSTKRAKWPGGVTQPGNPRESERRGGRSTPRRDSSGYTRCSSDGQPSGISWKTVPKTPWSHSAGFSLHQLRHNGARIRGYRFVRELAEPLQCKSGHWGPLVFLWRSVANQLS